MVKEVKVIKVFNGLGTLNTITLFGDERIAVMAQKRIERIDDKLSMFKPESEISKLNAQAGGNPVRLSDDTVQLISRAVEIAKASGGAFDITAAPLVKLWNIRSGRIPSDESIARVKTLVNHNDIIINGNDVMLARRGQSIDLGAIAKGYAADEAGRILRNNGVERAIINLGGNVLVLGGPWRVGVQNPSKMTGYYMGRVMLTDETMVTSGSNEQYFVNAGVRYHHIIDPRSGMPAQTGILSVSLIGRCSMDMDALSTAVFVLGPDQGMKLAKRYGAQAIFVTEKSDVFASEGLEQKFEMING